MVFRNVNMFSIERAVKGIVSSLVQSSILNQGGKWKAEGDSEGLQMQLSVTKQATNASMGKTDSRLKHLSLYPHEQF